MRNKTMISKNRRKKRIIIFPLILLIIYFFYWQNNDIVVTKIEYTNAEIPEAFRGYKILQVSDLHNKEFGTRQSVLLKKTKEIQPDIIVITGDLIDGTRTNIDAAMDFVNQAVKIAPIYYVTGNHEKWSGVYSDLESRLRNAGVIILENKSLLVSKEDNTLAIIGMNDPDFFDSYSNYYKTLEELMEKNADYFTILLSHRPELLNYYANAKVDLVFSGHAHGGQIRIPFIGGLYAPGQGIFPKLTEGLTKTNNTTIVVSRGLGNSVFPLRVFNRPELVVVTLENQ